LKYYNSTKNLKTLQLVSVYKVPKAVIPASEVHRESFCKAIRKIPNKPKWQKS